MCQKESWGAIFATMEAHSTQMGQPPRMHGPGLWRYEQKEQRVTTVPMSRVNCDLWYYCTVFLHCIATILCYCVAVLLLIVLLHCIIILCYCMVEHCIIMLYCIVSCFP